jgi:hypothetical protein
MNVVSDPNPYQSPQPSSHGPSLSSAPQKGGTIVFGAWVIVFLFNMGMPLFFALSMTGPSERIGMFVAALLLFVAGLLVCRENGHFAWSVIAGAIIVGISQAVPVLHVIAGLVGFQIAAAFGFTLDGNADRADRSAGVGGGLIVTLVVGGILLGASTGIGVILRLITPKHWWEPANKPSVDQA